MVRKPRAVPPVILRLRVADLADAVACTVAIRERVCACIAEELHCKRRAVRSSDSLFNDLYVGGVVRRVAGLAVVAFMRCLGVAVGAEPVVLGRGPEGLVV